MDGKDQTSSSLGEDNYAKPKKFSIKRAKEADIKSSSGNEQEESDNYSGNSDINLVEDDIVVEDDSTQPEDVVTPKAKEVKITKSKDFPLNKIRENLNPETNAVISKIESKVSKKEVASLVKNMEDNKSMIFENKVADPFESLSNSDVKALSKKLDEWSVPKEASDLNATVILAWLNKTKK